MEQLGLSDIIRIPPTAPSNNIQYLSAFIFQYSHGLLFFRDMYSTRSWYSAGTLWRISLIQNPIVYLGQYSNSDNSSSLDKLVRVYLSLRCDWHRLTSAIGFMATTLIYSYRNPDLPPPPIAAPSQNLTTRIGMTVFFVLGLATQWWLWSATSKQKVVESKNIVREKDEGWTSLWFVWAHDYLLSSIFVFKLTPIKYIYYF